MATNQSYPQTVSPRRDAFRYETLVLLGLVWVVSLVILLTPWVEENTLLKAVFLIPPVLRRITCGWCSLNASITRKAAR